MLWGKILDLNKKKLTLDDKIDFSSILHKHREVDQYGIRVDDIWFINNSIVSFPVRRVYQKELEKMTIINHIYLALTNYHDYTQVAKYVILSPNRISLSNGQDFNHITYDEVCSLLDVKNEEMRNIYNYYYRRFS